jgi:hypothetical protein
MQRNDSESHGGCGQFRLPSPQNKFGRSASRHHLLSCSRQCATNNPELGCTGRGSRRYTRRKVSCTFVGHTRNLWIVSVSVIRRFMIKHSTGWSAKLTPGEGSVEDTPRTWRYSNVHPRPSTDQVDMEGRRLNTISSWRTYAFYNNGRCGQVQRPFGSKS